MRFPHENNSYRIIPRSTFWVERRIFFSLVSSIVHYCLFLANFVFEWETAMLKTFDTRVFCDHNARYWRNRVTKHPSAGKSISKQNFSGLFFKEQHM